MTEVGTAATSQVQSFPPVARSDALVLVLGSMPGVRSLAENRYYAHPHNAFWPIMASLFDFSLELPYPQRLLRLQEHRVALWDVLACCQRQGSLDSAIDISSAQVNDFAAFFAAHNQLQTIFFNGGLAEQLFLHRVKPQLAEELKGLFLKRLPSTSPANARLKLEEKMYQWQTVRCCAAGL